MTRQEQEANIRFGRETGRLRRFARYTQARVANELGVSHGHLGNIENGKRTPDLRLVADLDRILHADGRLERLWAQLTGDGEPVWLDDLADLEQKAVSIMETQLGVFPALVQKERYATFVIRAISPDLMPDQVKASVQARMKRAEHFLDVSSTTRLWTVIPRQVLTLHLGEEGVMAEQLEHVLALSDTGKVSVQVVTKPGPHPGLAGAFKLITSHSAPEVLYVESAHSGRIIDDPAQVHRFRIVFGELQAVALSPEESLQVIRDELNGKSND